jgi:hypothetical protein
MRDGARMAAGSVAWIAAATSSKRIGAGRDSATVGRED